MLYVYLLCSFITMSCFGAAESVDKKQEFELWPDISSENPVIVHLYSDSKKIYGTPETGLYRPIRIKNMQQSMEQLEQLRKKKDALIINANTCKILEGGELVAREIMHHVNFLQFSIVEAEGKFELSPRICEFWQAIREQNKPKQSLDEPEPSSSHYRQASVLYKTCIQDFQQYEEIKRELLMLANEAIDANEDRTAASIMQFINDLEGRRGSQKEAAGHTPRTQEVADRLNKRGVKRMSKLDIGKVAKQI